MIEVTRQFEFATGHTITGHQGKCKHLHGHNYHGSVTVEGTLNELGMVVDFADLKEAIAEATDQWDHRFLIWEKDPRSVDLALLDPESIRKVPWQPTVENMAQHLKDMISIALTNRVSSRDFMLKPRVVGLDLWETENCSASA